MKVTKTNTIEVHVAGDNPGEVFAELCSYTDKGYKLLQAWMSPEYGPNDRYYQVTLRKIESGGITEGLAKRPVEVTKEFVANCEKEAARIISKFKPLPGIKQQ